MSKPIGIGFIGCGTVGQGALQLLSENAARLSERVGTALEVRRIAVRDMRKQRSPLVPAKLLTDNPHDVVDDPNVDLVVELMGGITPAGNLLTRALAAHKPVVTANKALLAEKGHELTELAASNNVDLYFEAAVAGGIPVIRVLRESFISDRVLSVRGIINGTSNYILSRMAGEGLAFADVLKAAQAAGYAEADPTLDVGGGDAGHKLAILARLAFGVPLMADRIPTRGITEISTEDMLFADRFGYTIKLLASAELSSPPEAAPALDASVAPTLIPKTHMLASISGALNAVLIDGVASGPCLLSGYGAGALPTAVSVVSDVVDVARNLFLNASGRISPRSVNAGGTAARGSKADGFTLLTPAQRQRSYYLRFSVPDKPGVLGQIATVLGEHHVSIEQMVQRGGQGRSDEAVSVVVLTHLAKQSDLDAALKQIRSTHGLTTQIQHIEIFKQH